MVIGQERAGWERIRVNEQRAETRDEFRQGQRIADLNIGGARGRHLQHVLVMGKGIAGGQSERDRGESESGFHFTSFQCLRCHSRGHLSL